MAMPAWWSLAAEGASTSGIVDAPDPVRGRRLGQGGVEDGAASGIGRCRAGIGDGGGVEDRAASGTGRRRGRGGVGDRASSSWRRRRGRRRRGVVDGAASTWPLGEFGEEPGAAVMFWGWDGERWGVGEDRGPHTRIYCHFVSVYGKHPFRQWTPRKKMDQPEADLAQDHMPPGSISPLSASKPVKPTALPPCNISSIQDKRIDAKWRSGSTFDTCFQVN
jgi:hypothetical protein